jgi:hypothetical protein
MSLRNRTFRTEIETPPEDTGKSVSYHRQRVIEEGGLIIGVATDQPGPLVIPFLPDLATTVRTVADPVTGQTVTISGAGLALWITADYEARNAAAEAAIAAEAAAALAAATTTDTPPSAP